MFYFCKTLSFKKFGKEVPVFSQLDTFAFMLYTLLVIPYVMYIALYESFGRRLNELESKPGNVKVLLDPQGSTDMSVEEQLTPYTDTDTLRHGNLNESTPVGMIDPFNIKDSYMNQNLPIIQISLNKRK